MKTLGNILWYFPFFGFINAIVVWICAAIWAVTIVGLPIAQGLFEFGKFLLKPFGNEMVPQKILKGADESANKAWKTWGNILGIIWIVCFGWWMAIFAVLQIAGLFISIIGIPVAIVMAKSIRVYLNPVGKICVPSLVKDEIEKAKIKKEYNIA